MKLVENFHKEAVGEYDDVFSPDALIAAIKRADPKDAFLLLVEDVCHGILFGARYNSPTSGREIFQEIIWYVNEPFRRYGVRLLKEAEKMLQLSGTSIMIMAVLENSKTEKLKSFYERLGFRKMETHYVRSLDGVR
jgi:hypothetical protein